MVREPDTVIAKWGDVADVFPLTDTGKAARLHSAVDGFVFPAGHEETKFKVFQVKVISGFIDFIGCDDPCATVLERSGDNSLVDGIAPCQPFYFHHENALPEALFHFRKKLLHHRAVLNRVAGPYFTVDRLNRNCQGFGQRTEDGFMAC